MKAILTLLFSLLFFTTRAQWQQVYADPSMGAMHIKALNKDTVFVLKYGQLLSTTDGGLKWDTLTFVNTQTFGGIQFTDQQHGFIAGATSFPTGPTFFRTSNAGATWQAMNYSAGPPFQTDVFFLDTDTGFISDGTILSKTQDGGNTFQPVAFGTGINAINDIHFMNSRVGFLATLWTSGLPGPYMENRIYKTNDQGATWTLVHNDNDMGNNSFVFAGITKLFFVNDTFGIAVGGEGKVLKTTDGGATWVNVANNLNDYNITDVDFLSVTTGYICYAGKVYYTNDGMQTWQLQDDPAQSYDIYSIDMLDASLGYAAGHGIFKTTNGGVTSAPDINNGIRLNIYPNPATERLFIDLPKSLTLLSAQLLDGEGRLLKQYPARTELNVSGLTGGIYWLRLHTSKGICIKSVVIR